MGLSCRSGWSLWCWLWSSLRSWLISYWLLWLSIALRLLVIALGLLGETLLWLVVAWLWNIALRLRGITWLWSISRLGLGVALRLLGITLRLLIITLGLSVAGLRRIALILLRVTLHLSIVGLRLSPSNRAAF